MNWENSRCIHLYMFLVAVAMQDIPFKSMKSGSFQLPDIASETLPSEIMLRCKVASDKNISFFHMLFICIDKSNMVSEENDIIISGNSDSNYWLEIQEEENDTTTISIFKINFKKCFVFLDKIDLYISNEYFMDFKNCSVEFHFGDESFRYMMECENNTGGIFCGTFAKVSDGWKFYPKMKEINLMHSRISDIKKNYEVVYSENFL